MTIVPGEPRRRGSSTSFRRRLKGKERKLQALPGYRYCVAQTDDRSSAARGIFRLKPPRMAEQKLPQRVRGTRRRGFYSRRVHARLAGGGHAIDIHAPRMRRRGDRDLRGRRRRTSVSMMFNTYTMSDNSRYTRA